MIENFINEYQVIILLWERSSDWDLPKPARLAAVKSTTLKT